MNRQYIGARYVPKIFTDEHGDSQWRDNIPYEALTIVTNLGNSYTSKKPVPVGVQIDNAEYWALTGNYNAQVEEYRQEVVRLEEEHRQDVVRLEEEIAKIDDKKYIILGDSYNISYDGTTETIVTSVGERIKNLFPDIADKVVANWAVGGASFNVKTGEYTFIEYLDLHYADIADRNSITDMLVFGGYNDVASNYNNTYNGGVNFCNKVKQYFPNCTVHLAPVAWGTRSAADMQKIVTNAYGAWSDIARDCSNAKYVNNSQDVLHIYDFCGADGVHPNDAGYTYLAKLLGSYLINGNIHPSITLGSVTNLSRFTDKITSDFDVVCNRENDTTFIDIRNRLIMSSGVHFAGDFITLYSVSGGIVRGFMFANNPTVKIPVMIWDGGNSTYATGELWFYDGYIALSSKAMTDITTTGQLIIFPTSGCVPTMLC